jgi:hypothetical protein
MAYETDGKDNSAVIAGIIAFVVVVALIIWLFTQKPPVGVPVNATIKPTTENVNVNVKVDQPDKPPAVNTSPTVPAANANQPAPVTDGK